MRYLCLLFVFITAISAKADRPNILFVFTDDQAPWAVGVAGHPMAKTPHMDELFNSGAYLPEQLYRNSGVQPVARKPDDQPVRNRSGHQRLDQTLPEMGAGKRYRWNGMGP